MNTSLRRISMMVMGLVVLLLINSTITQVFRADALRADPRNQRVLLDEYSRQRGQIAAGGQILAYSVATDGHYRFLRVYPDPQIYAPVTGFYSLRFSSTGLERAEDPVLNGSDERLFGKRLADGVAADQPGDLRALPAGLDVQGHHHRGGVAGRHQRERAVDRGADDSAAELDGDPGELRRGTVR